MSGILQQGYSLGYVFAACANLGVGGETNSWKTVFWIAGESTIQSNNVFLPLIICLVQPVSQLQLV
jgi:SHS family lactate transporter-like MFS transporter